MTKVLAAVVAVLIVVIGALVLLIDHEIRSNERVDHINFVIDAIANQEHYDAYQAQTYCLNEVQAYNVLREATKASVPLRLDSECGSPITQIPKPGG